MMTKQYNGHFLDDKYMLIAAIDLGTSLSGFAYANRREPNIKLDIIHKICCNNTSRNRDVMKTATCILFDCEGNFLAFGFNALEMFIELQNAKSHRNVMLFRDYKVHLYNSRQPLNTLMLTDIRGNSMLAKDIFTASIKAIKDDVLKSIDKAGQTANEKEIRWVLTVPAIWRDDAKKFMRHCAEKAGLPGDHLILALEPETASIYCQHLEIERSTLPGKGFTCSKPGTKYIVVDIGGGTTDITLHQKTDSSELGEIAPALGKPIGGTTIDSAFMELFSLIIGPKIMRQLKYVKLEAYLDICKNVEDMKKSLAPDTTGQIRVPIPCHTLSEIMEKMAPFSSSTLEKEVKRNSKPSMNARLVGDKISIEAEFIIKIFKQNLQPILHILKSTIETNFKHEETPLMILAGGLSENELLQDMVKKCFPSTNVIVAEPASLAVLKGAVLFGRNPNIINPRKTRYTYGFDSYQTFDESKHDIKRRFITDFTESVCNDLFSVIIKRNESVSLGDVRKLTYTTVKKNQAAMDFRLYSAETDDPVYIDDPGCKQIDYFSFDIPNPSEDVRDVTVECIFGDTELKINIRDERYQIENATKITLS